jgi:hypothetical protein
MLKLPELIEPLFRAAGWCASDRRLLETEVPPLAEELARCIAREFGGLQVGDCCAGTEQAASDIRFYKELSLRWCEVVAPWQGHTGTLWSFASAHCDHMVLLAGADGQFYVYSEPDDRLYAGGCDFGELMRKLLWGFRLGPDVPRLAS